jgi:hypothetical protein
VSASPTRIGFLFIGGAHQLLHFAPVAFELAQRENVDVTGYALDEGVAAAVNDLGRKLGYGPLHVEILQTPGWLRGLAKWFRHDRALKVPALLWNRKRFAGHYALVAAERTSTILKRLPGRAPRMIHIPHGAGDRAKSYERRIKLFDYIIVAGAKDRRRMIAKGVSRPEQCAVSGYVKLDALSRIGRPAAPEICSNRPTVLYAPHFDADLSSWNRYAKPLIAAFQEQGDFNLIVAPHVRLSATMSAQERARWESLATPGKIHIDFGSERSFDMSYTDCADIFVGDVSSQVYEFLTKPRPCVFLSNHTVADTADWRDHANYAHWRYGEVVDDPDALMAAVRRAKDMHGHYLAFQQQGVLEALGRPGASAIETAARQIHEWVAGAVERASPTPATDGRLLQATS